MRLGIVSFWFNRGQATVGRHLRSALDELGHETFVLARPTSETFLLQGFVDDTDVWDQPEVERASAFEIPEREYLAWARRHELDAVFCFQNYQFEELSTLRGTGVRTVGTFMRESFGAQHVSGARNAYDVVYALTGSDLDRFRSLGLDALDVPWGCHPELVADPPPPPDDPCELYFPGGYLSPRKPLISVLDALAMVDDPRLRLVVKVQGIPGALEPLRLKDLSVSKLRQQAAQSRVGRAALTRLRRQGGRAESGWVRSPAQLVARIQADRRTRLYLGDVPQSELMDLLGASHVVVAPSRWEGLGLHLYEAVGQARPLIVNDTAPLNEIVVDGVNGIVVPGRVSSTSSTGVAVHEVSVPALAGALRAVADPERRAELAAGARRRRDELSWDRTVAALDVLLKEIA